MASTKRLSARSRSSRRRYHRSTSMAEGGRRVRYRRPLASCKKVSWVPNRWFLEWSVHNNDNAYRSARLLISARSKCYLQYLRTCCGEESQTTQPYLTYLPPTPACPPACQPACCALLVARDPGGQCSSLPHVAQQSQHTFTLVVRLGIILVPTCRSAQLPVQ